MKVTSTGIINGIIEDKYGKRGTQFNEANIPTYSLPVNIQNPPKGTISYALILEDKDAIPVCGFSWIHWLAANITKVEIKENESILKKDFIQGVNSWFGVACNMEKEITSAYGGMTPPDRTHTYELHVFALDDKLNLREGFCINDLNKAMKGHILEQSTLRGCYIN